MMKRNHIIATVFVGSALLLALSCVQESKFNDDYRPEGTEIVFAAETGYENDEATRTVYSGQVYGSTTKYERIDWQANDPITISYVHGTSATADYYVTSVSGTTDENSYAGVDATGSKLTWTSGTSDHVFYAMYPANSNGSLTNNNHVTGVIPSSQPANASKMITPSSGEDAGITKYQPNTEEYGYMVAYKSVSSTGTESRVRLPFRPAVTTFEFRLRRVAGDLDRKISSIVLSTTAAGTVGTDLAGDFNLDITGEYQNPTGTVRGGLWTSVGTPSGGNRQKSITVDFMAATNNQGVSLPASTSSGYLDFAVLALPIDQTGIRITINYVDGGTPKYVDLKDGGVNGTWHTFTGAKKYIITNTTTPGEEVWHYVIVPIPDQEYYGHNTQQGEVFKVQSYKYSDRDPSVFYKVPWHLEYSTTGTSGSYSTTNSNTDFALASGSAASGYGVDNTDFATGENRRADIVTVNNQHDIDHPSAGQAARDALAHATPRGTSSNPFDLSKHPVYGNIDTEYDAVNGVVKTANCYVVSAPGYYKFPCVYGNAINGTSANPTAANLGAYDPYGTGAPLASVWTDHGSQDAVYMTPHFRNALNESITTPYILSDFTSVNNTDAVVVWQDTDEGDEIIKYGEDDLKLVGSGSSAYIQFFIDPENIKQGNVVIALRGAANGGSKKILWSWHIWVTERDISPVSSRDFMPVNLGWVDLTNAAVDKYTDRINYYRVVQDVPTGVTGASDDFYIKQIGDLEEIKSNVGGNPFYQWGRKDPITPQSAKRTSKSYKTTLSTYGPTYIKTFVNSAPYYDASLNWGPLHQSRYDEGITNPWLPLADPTTNSWICGQFYPPLSAFAHTSLGRGYNNGVLINIVNSVEVNANQHIHSGAPLRQVSSCVYNLWNASVWKSDDFGGVNKYKTVYDPCPPGFCVPTLDSFYGLTASEDTSGEGMNLDISGTSVFFPYAGARVFHGDAQGSNTYENDTYRSSGFYWTDTPSQTGKSTAYNEGTGTNNTWEGWWWYQFAKSLRFSTPNHFDYVPEDNHWGADNQTQRKGFDDVRANAFSVRPIADPKY